MPESTSRLPHRLQLDERSRLHLTGATEVVRFDEDTVELNTVRGLLIIHGRELRLKCLSLDDGAVVVQGQIDALDYAADRPRRRLFG